MKFTIKFDNHGEGRASFSFKIWLENKNSEDPPELFLFLSNRESPFVLEMIDTEYNKFLIEDDFKKTAGIKDTNEKRIKQFEEDPNLEGRAFLIPSDVNIEKPKPEILKNEIRKYVRDNDILLKILPINKEKKEIIQVPAEENPIIIFQFRISLKNFPSREVLEKWESSSESWSVAVDLHKEEGFEDIYEDFRDILKYPKVLDLWVNIPHNHLFIASSPVYKSAIKLKTEDIQYKTYEKYEKEKKDFLEKFETMEGDYAVQIKNIEKKPQKFSIICVSPFLPGEEPGKLREDINVFKKESQKLETSRKEMVREIERSHRDMLRNMVSIFGIFVAIFSFIVISANYALRIVLPSFISSLKEAFLYISAMLSPIFLFLVLLLIISYLIAKNNGEQKQES